MDTAPAATKSPIPPEVEWSDADHREQKLSDRLANWARITAEYKRPPSGTCGSIEGLYRPERNSEQTEEEKRAPKRTQAERDAAVRDAWLVEDAWRELPEIYRFCLQFVYLKRWKPQHVWRKLGPYRSRKQRIRDYDEVLRLSRFALANQLRRREQSGDRAPLARMAIS